MPTASKNEWHTLHHGFRRPDGDVFLAPVQGDRAYRNSIVEAGFFQSSHAINLLDSTAKYADMVNLQDRLACTGELADGLFERPSGHAVRSNEAE